MFFFSSETRTVEKKKTQKYYSECVCIDLFQILYSILVSLFLAKGVVKCVSVALQAGVFLIRHSKGLFLDHYRRKTEHQSWHCSQFCLDSGTICCLIPERELTSNSLDASVVLSVGWTCCILRYVLSFHLSPAEAFTAKSSLMTVLGIWKTDFENICKIECQQEKSVLCHWRGRCRFFIGGQIKSKWHCLVLYISVLHWLSLQWFSSVSRFGVRNTNFAIIVLCRAQRSTLLIPNVIGVNTNVRRIGYARWTGVQFRYYFVCW